MIKIDNFSLSFNFFSNSLSASICENALGRHVAMQETHGDQDRDQRRYDTRQDQMGIVDEVEIFPLTQSMIVVTSPIGDQAPPLFAAIIMILPNTHRSL